MDIHPKNPPYNCSFFLIDLTMRPFLGKGMFDIGVAKRDNTREDKSFFEKLVASSGCTFKELPPLVLRKHPFDIGEELPGRRLRIERHGDIMKGDVELFALVFQE
jgi:hypothetical protein